MLLYCLLLPRVYMEYDMGFWREWAIFIQQHGISHAYDCPSLNYFPVFIYGLYVFDLLHGNVAEIAAHINSIKILFVLFDFLPLIVLQLWGKYLLPFKAPYTYLLLNIAYVFNSMVWGQIDSIYTSFAFLALVTAFRFPVASVVLYILALNTKPQAIEFLPVLLLVWATSTSTIRQWVAAVLSGAALQLDEAEEDIEEGMILYRRYPDLLLIFLQGMGYGNVCNITCLHFNSAVTLYVAAKESIQSYR
ncbi:MAG: hypothetical protein EBZ77_04230 [Chitinophagia bacterium]|nr:hypothetical protein [Chitinophagia bacterium]